MSSLFRRRGREEAESAQRACDDTFRTLKSGAEDLGPARRLRARSAELAAKHAYRDAVATARTAEETAKALHRLHSAATSGLSRLKSERARMADLGMAVEEMDALIVDASSWLSKTTERYGDPKFPAYSKAADLAVQGLRLARDRIPRFQAASAAVSEADLALRRIAEANRFVERNAFDLLVLKPAADALGEAKAKLRANAFDETEELVGRTLAMARKIHGTYRRAAQAYESALAGASALRSEGAVMTEVEASLETCRVALENAKFDDAANVADRAAARLRELREEYRSLVLGDRKAEEAIQQVEAWGFDTREPREILQEARNLSSAGRYREAALRLDQAREAGQGLRETHRTSASRIAEMRRSVALIRAVNAASAEEAEALLGRAEAFLEEGRYRACEENLKLASVLLADVKGDGPR